MEESQVLARITGRSLPQIPVCDAFFAPSLASNVWKILAGYLSDPSDYVHHPEVSQLTIHKAWGPCYRSVGRFNDRKWGRCEVNDSLSTTSSTSHDITAVMRRRTPASQQLINVQAILRSLELDTTPLLISDEGAGNGGFTETAYGQTEGINT
ncbi:hypothetical protein ARMGADRAFT_1085461 [Armillaria gallica]|uniref:Uncharacterized protein n=1 Tax=Armillaria gallica TaxID=47427 RepID=A0A2H3CWN2_ARMGA|nr:hypothetical protein ARMGADRAFT_1085461 [Armillaria gallica]